MPKEGKPSVPISFRDLKRIYMNGYFNVFLILSVLVSIPNMMNYTFISLYIDELGGSEIIIGWAFFIAAIGEVPVFLLLDRYLKTTSKAMVGVLAATSLLFSVRWFLMGLAVTPSLIAVVQLLHSVTFGIYFYTGTKLSAHLVPMQYRASGQVTYAIAWSGLSGILVGLFGGWIYEWLGPRGMYGLGGFMSFIGVIGFTVMWQRLK
jgi:PPP family 3-phenylpropionic acid transporter